MHIFGSGATFSGHNVGEVEWVAVACRSWQWQLAVGSWVAWKWVAVGGGACAKAIISRWQHSKLRLLIEPEMAGSKAQLAEHLP